MPKLSRPVDPETGQTLDDHGFLKTLTAGLEGSGSDPELTGMASGLGVKTAYHPEGAPAFSVGDKVTSEPEGYYFEGTAQVVEDDGELIKIKKQDGREQVIQPFNLRKASLRKNAADQVEALQFKVGDDVLVDGDKPAVVTNVDAWSNRVDVKYEDGSGTEDSPAPVRIKKRKGASLQKRAVNTIQDFGVGDEVALTTDQNKTGEVVEVRPNTDTVMVSWDDDAMAMGEYGPTTSFPHPMGPKQLVILSSKKLKKTSSLRKRAAEGGDPPEGTVMRRKEDPSEQVEVIGHNPSTGHPIVHHQGEEDVFDIDPSHWEVVEGETGDSAGEGHVGGDEPVAAASVDPEDWPERDESAPDTSRFEKIDTESAADSKSMENVDAAFDALCASASMADITAMNEEIDQMVRKSKKPPSVSEEEMGKLKKQYPGEPDKQYGTAWKIHKLRGKK
jgi:hypothetical protein